ncbi:hypothetical protein F4604DRAFT_1687558 [Suillus subluteus]|nr:hypothetical protein F4604DRAFT_1687558 [Suillus subluteus]
MTLNQCTAATIFWTLDQMRQADAQLASIKTEAIAENEIIEDTCVMYCYMSLLHKPDVTESTHNIGHYQYLNRHNQPKAHLIQSHAVMEKFCMPITINRISNTSVDGIMNGMDVRTFINDLSSQAKSQITLAQQQSHGCCAPVPYFWALAVFLPLQWYSILVYYLQRKTIMLIVITSIPTCFCVLSRFLACIGDCQLWPSLVQDAAPVTSDIYFGGCSTEYCRARIEHTAVD